MTKEFDIEKLPAKINRLNVAIMERLMYIIEQYELYNKTLDSIPPELNRANNILNRLLDKRIGLVKRYIKSGIKVSNFSVILGLLAIFPQEIQYLLYRRTELISDRKLFRRNHAYIKNRDKHIELEEKRKIVSSLIDSLNVTELNNVVEYIGDLVGN